MPTAKKSATTTTAEKADAPAASKSAGTADKPAKKAAPAKKTAEKTAPAKKAAPAKKTTTKKTAEQPAAASEPKATDTSAATAEKPEAAETSEKAAEPEAKAAPATAGDADLPHLPGEDAWTAEEVAEVRDELEADQARMSESIEQAEADLAELLQEGRDGAGLDPADVGSSNFERDQEMSLTANMRDTLEQTEHALNRLNTGRYGICESCGEPIGKGRLLAFPRATMCVTCKTREERR